VTYFVILPHNTTQKCFVISFVFIPFLRNNSIMHNVSSQMSCRLFKLHVNLCILQCVVKDREAPFSPHYVRLKNYKNLSSYVVPRSLISASVVELILSRNLTRLKYYANWIHSPNSHVSFIGMQLLSKTLKSLKRNQMFF